MQLDNTFHVPIPVEEAWGILLDVPRVAPCLPGTALEGQDGDVYSGRVKIKIGSITASYRGEAQVTATDQTEHTAVIAANGREQRGTGRASAQVRMRLTPSETGTLVELATELSITGKAAQFGRGILADVSGRLIDQFAGNLAREIAAPTPTLDHSPPATVEPLSPPASRPASPVGHGGTGAPQAVRVVEEPEPFDVLGAVLAGRTRTYVQIGLAMAGSLTAGVLIGRALRSR